MAPEERLTVGGASYPLALTTHGICEIERILDPGETLSKIIDRKRGLVRDSIRVLFGALVGGQDRHRGDKGARVEPWTIEAVYALIDDAGGVLKFWTADRHSLINRVVIAALFDQVPRDVREAAKGAAGTDPDNPFRSDGPSMSSAPSGAS
jgi:hypothetical protein